MNYIDKGWIVDLRERLNEIGGKLWIEDAWQPQLQREGDFSLMERFLSVKTTTRQQNQLRMVLHWLRVITLADLADPTGRSFQATDWPENGKLNLPLNGPGNQDHRNVTLLSSGSLFVTPYASTRLPGNR
jgi:hypothetical protein